MAVTQTKSSKNKKTKIIPIKKTQHQKTAVKTSVQKTKDNFGGLDKQLLLTMHQFMVKTRVLEERLIKIYRAGESFFWIGGPGEEAWGVPVGLLVNKGRGPLFDYVHLHYRCSPTLMAMGVSMVDSIRLMMNRSTDPSTGGRNFSNHFSIPDWNVAPVTSPLEVQYPIACGTAHAQKRHHTKNFSKNAITVVTGGDAGTAEGDFASALILASRKGQELPVLLTVQNNKWGISTSYEGQHGETFIADRAKAFNIKSQVINGNDPVETYLSVQENMNYIRKTGKPAFIEAQVSRLYGHSSASGANQVPNEVDPVKEFEQRMLKAGLITEKESQKIWIDFESEGVRATEIARSEPVPTADSIWNHTFVGNENADWRKF
jgi:2-oxoisovalerate dehydrogenase E1 component alpha subunit